MHKLQEKHSQNARAMADKQVKHQNGLHVTLYSLDNKCINKVPPLGPLRRLG
uniref:Uncharacterized protein n=1 Tax=Arion vulgaris TaxID=1028688 RepID=A0A0B7AMG1_9EUPU